jgi:putative SOS response-associated peptidase YedK
MAGLWEQWESPDGSLLLSCAIVTVEPNDVVRPIHSRMPAILDQGDEQRWLGEPRGSRAGPPRGPTLEEQVMTLLRPCPSDLLEAYPVSRYVNNPANNGPPCIARGA